MREDDEALLRFCVDQKQHFVLNDWVQYPNRETIELVVLLLLSATGYNQSERLNQLCKEWRLNPATLPDRIKMSRFDVPRFVSMLKHRLSLIQDASS